jgi:SAM-dependent methyltransferase
MALADAVADTGANAAQRAAWNDVQGPKWLRHEDALEASLAAVATLLLAQASPSGGERVLEVGCGAGTLLARLAALVGSAGTVTGLDISATMLAVAGSRAPASVRLLERDAQTEALDGPYDLILSRFGVMFFADPAAAFHNLRGALAPGGRLCFACWAGLDRNPQWAVPLEIAARHVGPPAQTDPRAPGPMAFADPDYVRDLLGSAGFATVQLNTLHFPFQVADAAQAAALAVTMGPAAFLLREREAGPATIAAVRAEIAQAWQKVDGTIHLVTARP